MIGSFRPDGEGPCYFGLYPAIVTDLVDPDDLGRVECKFPWLGTDGKDVRAWATLLSPYADNNQGLQCLPEVDSQVVVGFEAGDVRRPYVVGAAWNGKEGLPEKPSKLNNKRLIQSRARSRLEFDDAAEGAKVTLSMASGHQVTMDDVTDQIEVKHANGSAIQFDSAGQIIISANTKVLVDAPSFGVSAGGVEVIGGLGSGVPGIVLDTTEPITIKTTKAITVINTEPSTTLAVTSVGPVAVTAPNINLIASDATTLVAPTVNVTGAVTVTGNLGVSGVLTATSYGVAPPS